MLFDSLFENASNIDSLDLYVKENIEEIASFSNQVFSDINCNKDSIVSFILLKHQVLKNLDYNKSYNKAFISILIEICERLGESACIVSLYSIFQENEIYLGERLNAVLLYLYNIQDRNQYIDRFDEICLKITYSIENEEDNINKPVASFLNYYAYVVYNTQPHLQFAERLKQIIEKAIKEKKYNFLEHEFISEILNISFSNIENHFTESQKLVDSLLGKIDYVEKYFDSKELLIENETEYSNSIKAVKISFTVIRQISNNLLKEQVPTGRGASILTSEQQLFTYVYSFGNMHKAKLDSAFKFLPSDIVNKPLDIIDWGCGQGLATISFFDNYGVNKINSCILIEPSEISIKRAALHIKMYNEELKVKTICKKLDSLRVDDLPKQKNNRLHLFSNILDIDDYSQSQLFEFINSSIDGINYFVCVSPYIDDRKTDRVNNFLRLFEKNVNEKIMILGKELNSKSIDSVYWCCNNKYKNNMCFNHPVECQGRKKWTRVINVFKV